MLNWKKRLVLILTAAVLAAAGSMVSLAKTRLDTVGNPYWSNTPRADNRDEREGSFARWDEVEHAYEYEVYLYCDDDTGRSGYVARTKTKKPYCSLRGKMKKSGDYYFKVRALPKNNREFSDGAWSEYSGIHYVNVDAAENPDIPEEPTARLYVPDSWKQDDKGWWYERADGTYPSGGWFQDPGNQQWFYFDEAGYVKTGWIMEDDNWYYCDADGTPVGSMVTGEREIDGILYHFDAAGALIQ